jgi:hypothetical protein
MDTIVVGSSTGGTLNITMNKAYENCSIALQKYSLTNYAFYNHAETETFYIVVAGTAVAEYVLVFPENITQNSLCIAVNSLPVIAGTAFLKMTYSGTEYTLNITLLASQNTATISLGIGPIFNRYLNGIANDKITFLNSTGAQVTADNCRLVPQYYGYELLANRPVVVNNLIDLIGWSVNRISNTADATMMIFRAQNTSQNFLNEPVIGVKVNAPLEVYNSQYIDIIMPKTNSITISEENENLYWVQCNYLPINLTFTLVYLSRDRETNTIREIPFRRQTSVVLTLLISPQSVSDDKP